MRLLVLDLATRLGWSSGDTEAGDPVSGFHKLPSGSTNDAKIGEFLEAYHMWLIDKLKEQDPSMVVFEAPIPATGRTNMTTLMRLWGLCNHTEFVCQMKGIDVRQVSAVTWKNAICKQGNFSKAVKPYPPIRKCHELGWEHIKDDNEADALCLWIYSVRFASPGAEARFDPLFSTIAA